MLIFAHSRCDVDRYEEDAEFRRYATDYLTQFDRVMAEAKEIDPENVLSSTFLTSDVVGSGGPNVVPPPTQRGEHNRKQ